MEKQPDYSSKRFLIVDDEQFMLGLVERMLKDCKAGLIMKANDGGAALRAVKDNFTQVDVILADYNMKPVNGLQLLQGIRMGVNPKIPREQPFIMLTGHGETDVVKTALALDVHGYVVKPVSAEKLVQTIDKVLSRAIEIKDPDYYRGIRIPKAQPSLQGEPGQVVSGWTVMPKSSPFRSDEGLRKKLNLFKTEHATQDGAIEVKLKNRRECAVNELLEGQILYDDIQAEEGAVLLRRGTHLTKGMIQRLRELAAETHPEQTIYIGELAG